MQEKYYHRIEGTFPYLLLAVGVLIAVFGRHEMTECAFIQWCVNYNWLIFWGLGTLSILPLFWLILKPSIIESPVSHLAFVTTLYTLWFLIIGFSIYVWWHKYGCAPFMN